MGMILGEKKVVVLTGAGISAESGVRTFRDNDGLWENHRVEDVATPEAWIRDQSLVWRFYQARRNQLLEVEPNRAHLALAQLESKTESLTLITQNVDDLHERGGSESVIHMHGRLQTLRCETTGLSEVRMEEEDLGSDFVLCNCCSASSRMRPDIVWFGEIPMEMDVIYREVENCDVFIVIGSSGHVYPAAGLVNLANLNGAHTILVNFELPINGGDFDEVHIGKAGEILPDIVENW
jgi:NAD-dependent deacetylase